MSKACAPLWREAHLKGKMHKTPHVRATNGRPDRPGVRKVHATVGRSTFKSQHVKTPHVRATYGRPDVVLMSKNCTPLWREAHLEVKCVKKCVLSHF